MMIEKAASLRPSRRRVSGRPSLGLSPDTSRRASAGGRDSGGIVEDHADGASFARIEPADAVVQLHLIVAAPPLHRTAVDREDGRIALLERQNHGAGLHAGALLGHHELAALEVLARLIQ